MSRVTCLMTYVSCLCHVVSRDMCQWSVSRVTWCPGTCVTCHVVSRDISNRPRPEDGAGAEGGESGVRTCSLTSTPGLQPPASHVSEDRQIVGSSHLNTSVRRNSENISVWAEQSASTGFNSLTFHSQIMSPFTILIQVKNTEAFHHWYLLIVDQRARHGNEQKILNLKVNVPKIDYIVVKFC